MAHVLCEKEDNGFLHSEIIIFLIMYLNLKSSKYFQPACLLTVFQYFQFFDSI